jgi:hypothetical protein
MERSSTLAIHSLSMNFQFFFSKLNSGSSFEQRASSEHNTILGLIEDKNGLAAELEPVEKFCFHKHFPQGARKVPSPDSRRV